MIDGITTIARRLDALATAFGRAAEERRAEDEQRYIRASVELVGRERDKLERALQADDTAAALWNLRSVSDMMKGLIDIGSDLPALVPDAWREANSIANDAHVIEFKARER